MPQAKTRLREIAKRVVQETQGDTTTGASLLLDRFSAELPDEYAERQLEVMRHWAQGYIATVRTGLRRRLATIPAGKQSIPKQALSAASLRAVRDTWFEWVLPGGGYLGDATKTKILEAAHQYETTSITSAARGRWLHTIANNLPDNSTPVRKALTVVRLDRMAKECGVTMKGASL